MFMEFIDKRHEKRVVSCPFCGTRFFEGITADLVKKCEICKRFVVCIVLNGEVRTFESKRKSERKS